MTVYSVEFSRPARRELQRLPARVVQRVILAVRALQENPRPRGSLKLVGAEAGYRVRVGQYRVVYEVNDAIHAVLVTRVRHRKEAYD